MLFDTDVLFWAFRGYPSAQKEIDNDDSRFISAVTYMELIQGARNKTEQMQIKNFLCALEFEILPIDENISHRATIFMEEFAVESGIQLADALILPPHVKIRFAYAARTRSISKRYLRSMPRSSSLGIR